MGSKNRRMEIALHQLNSHPFLRRNTFSSHPREGRNPSLLFLGYSDQTQSNSKQILCLDVFKKIKFNSPCTVDAITLAIQKPLTKGNIISGALQHHTTARISHLKWPSPANTKFGSDVFRQKPKLTKGGKKIVKPCIASLVGCDLSSIAPDLSNHRFRS